MLKKKIAWERWDEDVIEQEIVDNFYDLHHEDDDEEVVEDALIFLQKMAWKAYLKHKKQYNFNKIKR